MLSTQQQLAESERWDPEDVTNMQFGQLLNVIAHARETVPYYRDRLPGKTPDTSAGLAREWTEVPLLRRRTVQEARDRLLSEAVPPGHDNLHVVETSGSTGTPVATYGTDITRYYWYAFTLREHLWHGRDFETLLMSIRPETAVAANEVQRANGWGPATDSVYPTGPMIVMNSSTDIARQAAALAAANPAYLLSLPSNLLALIDYCETAHIALPRLREVRTFAEALNPRVRERCLAVWGVPVIDTYSAQEVGYIAAQCPENEHYHVQSENLLLEVLDENDVPCAPGKIGRVVLTTLHNFAMPLIRYEIGDYAEVGADRCSCGRRLPTLTRILGRERNMLTLPDGRRMWPSFPSELWLKQFPIRQLQLVQLERDRIEARIAASGPMSAEQERGFAQMLAGRLGYPFDVTYTYPDEIERGANGKFEDFISRV